MAGAVIDVAMMRTAPKAFRSTPPMPTNGHRRTNDDKRRAVDIMLADPEWGRTLAGDSVKQAGIKQACIALWPIRSARITRWMTARGGAAIWR